MANFKMELCGINVFEHDYENWRDRETRSLESYGAAFKFAEWMRSVGLIDEYETDLDVYNNMSGLRDGNRLDIHDNYKFFLTNEYNLEISFLYIVNSNLWAVLYDRDNNAWFGDIEIPNI